MSSQQFIDLSWVGRISAEICNMVLSANVTMNLPITAMVTVATELPNMRPHMPCKMDVNENHMNHIKTLLIVPIAAPEKKRLPAPLHRLPM